MLDSGRSYDAPKISRWENGREAVPDDVATELEAMVASRADGREDFSACKSERGGRQNNECTQSRIRIRP